MTRRHDKSFVMSLLFVVVVTSPYKLMDSFKYIRNMIVTHNKTQPD